MTVHIIYRATGEKICTYYNCEEIKKDDNYVAHSCTLRFGRDNERDITILSPCTVNLDKFKVLIETE